MAEPRLPVVICIDVEPDDLHPRRGSREPWHGFLAAHSFFSAARPRLEKAPGSPVRFSGFFRMDQQVVDVYGSASWAVDRHPEVVEDILRHGDGLGIHPHPYRWLPEAASWLFDFGDQDWVEEILTLSLDTFAAAFGRTCTDPRRGPVRDVGVASNCRVGSGLGWKLPGTVRRR